MSLIYKALEKAQQEKAKEEIPPRPAKPLQADPVVEEGSLPARRFPIAGIVCLAGVIFCAVYLYAHPAALSKLFTKQAAPTAMPAAVVAQDQVTRGDTVQTSEPVILTPPSPQENAAPAAEAKSLPAVTAAEPAPAIAPSATTSTAPDIKISGIISDDNSSLAIINGKVLSEGDVIANGVHIKKIYKDSVVVESDGKEQVIRK